MAAFLETRHYGYGIVTILLGYYILSSFRAYWRLRHFKGPALAAWSDLWFIRASGSGKCHLYLSDVSTKYGSLARIGPNTLVTCSEELFRRINNPRSGYYKADWYKAFRFGAEKENVFSETANDGHARLRKRAAAGYSGKDNPELEADIDNIIMSLVKSWKERYLSSSSTTKAMDLAMQMQYLTLDIITCLSFGEPFGWVSTDSDLYGYISTMATNFPIMFFMSAVPSLVQLQKMPWVQRLLGPSVKDRVGMGKIKAVSNGIIDKRFSELQSNGGKHSKLDMTASFMSHKMTRSEIADGALLAILAGSDTSASALRTGFISLLSSPKVLRTLQQECADAGISKDQVIPYSRALELPYLQACVKESLRYHPVGTGLLPRIVPPQGDYFEGKFIPGGTVIGQCAWNMLRLNYTAFGPDANVFRPERWTEAWAAAEAGDSSCLDQMEKAQELVFGYGEFKCLGYKLALMELSKILFEVTRRFDIGLLNGLHPMEVNFNCGLFIQEGLWVRLEER